MQHTRKLALGTDPRSVRDARTWVRDVLVRMGREDLIESAVLGVSELVTNAILHSEPPIAVRVRGTRARPRVEVYDSSQQPPEQIHALDDDEHLLSTIGRGLSLVGLFSDAWGSDIDDAGKVVWFEPAPEVHEHEGGATGEMLDFDALADLERPPLSGPTTTVKLLDMPVQVWAHYRTYYTELRRELRLLTITHAHTFPLAEELSRLFLQVEEQRRVADGVHELDAAIERGADRVDLTYLVSPESPPTMRRMGELLELAGDFSEAEALLALAPTPQQVALQRWYFGEFARQGAGQAPIPWPGGFAVEDARPRP